MAGVRAFAPAAVAAAILSVIGAGTAAAHGFESDPTTTRPMVCIRDASPWQAGSISPGCVDLASTPNPVFCEAGSNAPSPFRSAQGQAGDMPLGFTSSTQGRSQDGVFHRGVGSGTLTVTVAAAQTVRSPLYTGTASIAPSSDPTGGHPTLTTFGGFDPVVEALTSSRYRYTVEYVGGTDSERHGGPDNLHSYVIGWQPSSGSGDFRVANCGGPFTVSDAELRDRAYHVQLAPAEPCIAPGLTYQWTVTSVNGGSPRSFTGCRQDVAFAKAGRYTVALERRAWPGHGVRVEQDVTVQGRLKVEVKGLSAQTLARYRAGTVKALSGLAWHDGQVGELQSMNTLSLPLELQGPEGGNVTCRSMCSFVNVVVTDALSGDPVKGADVLLRVGAISGSAVIAGGPGFLWDPAAEEKGMQLARETDRNGLARFVWYPPPVLNPQTTAMTAVATADDGHAKGKGTATATVLPSLVLERSVRLSADDAWWISWAGRLALVHKSTLLDDLSKVCDRLTKGVAQVELGVGNGLLSETLWSGINLPVSAFIRNGCKVVGAPSGLLARLRVVFQLVVITRFNTLLAVPADGLWTWQSQFKLDLDARNGLFRSSDQWDDAVGAYLAALVWDTPYEVRPGTRLRLRLYEATSTDGGSGRPSPLLRVQFLPALARLSSWQQSIGGAIHLYAGQDVADGTQTDVNAAYDPYRWIDAVCSQGSGAAACNPLR